MKIQKFIANTLLNLFEQYKAGKITDNDTIAQLREEGKGSDFLFDILLDKMLYLTYSQGYIIVSKGMLKLYLQSNCKQNPDYVNRSDIIGEADVESYEINNQRIDVKRGIFIKIIEKLALKKTLEAYIKYLLVQEGPVGSRSLLITEIPEKHELVKKGLITKKDLKEYRNLDPVIEILFEEFDSKHFKERYIKL